MAPFSTSYITLYWSAIVSKLYLVPFSSYLKLNNIMTLKTELDVTQGHWVPFESLGTVSHLHSIVTVALSCVISETKWDIGRICWFFISPLHSMPLSGGSYWKTAIPFGTEKLEWFGYLMVKKSLVIYLDVLTEYWLVTNRRTDRWTNRQTDILQQHSLCYVQHHAVKMENHRKFKFGRQVPMTSVTNHGILRYR